MSKIPGSSHNDSKKRKGKQGLHGEIYQLKLLMLFLKRGIDNKYSFRLCTEKKEAKKFDDLFFEITKNGKKEYRLLQAKHKENENLMITFDSLLTESDGDYSLVKYFFSYHDSKKERLFKDGVIKDVTLCTNIDMYLDDEYQFNGVCKTLREVVQKIDKKDDILDVSSGIGAKVAVRYRFHYDTALLLKPKLQDYNLNRLARRLVECLLKNKPIDHHDKNDIFKTYHTILSKEVIEVKSKKFFDEFLNDPNSLSGEASRFRKVLIEQLNRQSQGKLSLDEVNVKITASRIDFNLGSEFGVVKDTSFQKWPQDISGLARSLIENILNAKPIKHNKGPFRNCHFLLANEVVDVKEKKFLDKFISGIGISKDAEQFRGALEKEAQSQGKLSLEKINKTFEDNRDNEKIGLNLTLGFGRGSGCDWPNDAISDKDIKDFLDHLVFAVNQPGEEELGKIVENYIHKEFNFAATDYVYNKFFLKMLDWLNGKGDEFISYQDGKSFFIEAKQNLCELELTGLTLEYKSKVKEFGIEFSSNVTQVIGLDSFLAQNTIQQVFNVISQQSALSAVKVYEILQGMNISQERYIFMQLDSVLRLLDHVIQAFNGSCDLLVIECKSAEKEENVQILFDKLSTVLQSSNKKVVCITQKQGNLLANKFKSAIGNKYQEKNDEKNSLTDLTPDSQYKLLSKQVVFQGEKIKLGTLIEQALKHLVDAEVLSKLINKETIEIGKALADSNYYDLKDYYINRTFYCRYIKIKKSFQEEKSKFLVMVNKQVEPIPQSYQDIVLISHTDEDFKKLCDKYQTHNIHWLKEERDYFIWQQSHGTLSKLREFVDTNEQRIQEYKPEKITDIPDRVVIIAAEPGMGKSSVLTRLALKTKESDPSLWVIRINLLDQSSRLCEWQKEETDIDELQAVKFLYGAMDFRVFRENGELTKETKEQMLSSILKLVPFAGNDKIALKNELDITGLNLLEVSLFCNFYERGKIVLLFDGFDEINPDYKDQVIKLLEFFKCTKAEKIWMTTRPYNLEREPENQLGTFSFTLRPFLEEEQRTFLKKFWRKNLKLDKLDENIFVVFIDRFLHKFSVSTNDQEMEFGGIPLQIVMIAEFISDKLEKFLSEENEQALCAELNLVTLYEDFLDKKLDKELRKDNFVLDQIKDNPQTKKQIMGMRKTFKKDHKKLAIYAMFEEDKLEKLLSKQEIEKVHTLIDDIKQGEERTGIIDKFINGKPSFTHRTFAEYLAANYLWEKFKSIQFDKFEGDIIESIIIKNLIKEDRIQMCKFFELNTQRDLENNFDFPYKEDKLKMLLMKLVDETYNYCPLEAEKNKQSTKLLLNVIEYCLSANEESDLVMIRNVQNVKSCKKMALLSVSAEMAYKEIASALQLNGDYLIHYLRNDKWFYSPLWIAAKSGNLYFMKEILIDKFSYDPNWEDKDKKNLLQRILQMNDFDVLRSCLKLDVVDVRTRNGKVLPLTHCIKWNAPSDVIELLIEKTDFQCVNQFVINEIPDVVSVIGYLIPYDNKFLDLLVEKDIDLNAGYFDGGIRKTTPINVITSEFQYSSLDVPKYSEGRPEFSRYFFYSDKEFSKFFNLVQSLLEYGAIYNLEDCGVTILQILKQTHYIRELFITVFQTSDKGNETVCNLLDKMLCYEKNQKIQPSAGVFFVPEYIKPLLSRAHNNGDTDDTFIKDTLNDLSTYVEAFQQEIEKLKYGGYDVEEILEKLENRRGSICNSIKCLLKRILTFYINQNYDIDEAFTEVSEEALKFNKKKSYVKNLPTDEILNPQVIEVLISKINESNGLCLLNEVLEKLNDIGQKNKKEVIESILRFSEPSTPTYKLLKTIDDLFDAVGANNKKSVVRILQDADPSFLKTAAKVHNKERKTLLDLTKELNNIEIENLLRNVIGAKYSDECRQRNPATFTPHPFVS